ncbi:hypothetical protein DFP72DRAFT_896514, partial [Ephemerocybe angulata]
MTAITHAAFQDMPTAVGYNKYKEMIMTGHSYNAPTANKIVYVLSTAICGYTAIYYAKVCSFATKKKVKAAKFLFDSKVTAAVEAMGEGELVLMMAPWYLRCDRIGEEVRITSFGPAPCPFPITLPYVRGFVLPVGSGEPKPVIIHLSRKPCCSKPYHPDSKDSCDRQIFCWQCEFWFHIACGVPVEGQEETLGWNPDAPLEEQAKHSFALRGHFQNAHCPFGITDILAKMKGMDAADAVVKWPDFMAAMVLVDDKMVKCPKCKVSVKVTNRMSTWLEEVWSGNVEMKEVRFWWTTKWSSAQNARSLL